MANRSGATRCVGSVSGSRITDTSTFGKKVC